MKLYKINWEYDHLIKNDYDLINIDNFDSISEIKSITGVRDVILPKEINFKSNICNVKNINYPVNDLHLPIVNKEIFNVFFEKIKPKNIVKINIYNNGKRVDDAEFYTFQLGSYFDCFDYENSVYESDFILPISKISKFFLKPSDFPDIFRINVCIPDLFVNEVIKNKLELIGVNDIIFEEVETTPTIV